MSSIIIIILYTPWSAFSFLPPLLHLLLRQTFNPVFTTQEKDEQNPHQRCQSLLRNSSSQYVKISQIICYHFWCQTWSPFPGFNDTCLHLHDSEDLKQLTQNGLATSLDIASFSSALISAFFHALADSGRFTEIQKPINPASIPASEHSHIPGFPANELISIQRMQDGLCMTRSIKDWSTSTTLPTSLTLSADSRCSCGQRSTEWEIPLFPF